MASGWAKEGAVQEQIDQTVDDAVAQARERLQPAANARADCAECGEPIPAARRAAVPGVQFCVACQGERDENERAARVCNRRASKDSQLR